jgi:hypothetical protein
MAMPKSIMVAVASEVLGDSDLLHCALIWAGQGDWLVAGGDEFVIRASRYDPNHHFGPVLTVDSPEGGLEIILPWKYVHSVVTDTTGKMAVGFRPKAVKKPEAS